MKILSIGGTRPQFVKMAIVVEAFNEYNINHSAHVQHRILHTGQHFDASMSEIFFEELGIPAPQMLPCTSSSLPGQQTACMLTAIEAALIDWMPDVAVIYGDTNSTLAAALAAAKLHIPLIHLEAGLRSFNRQMQEEINRIVSDHVSDLLLCPTLRAVDQLEREGLGDRACFVGDVMLDAAIHFADPDRESANLRGLSLSRGGYALVTLHRAENTNSAARLHEVTYALSRLPIPVVLPMHPRLKLLLGEEGRKMLAKHKHIHTIEPVGYLEMLSIEAAARVILTDSGGVQKEAYFLGVPCLTMRDETEWGETLHGGWNSLVGTDPACILKSVDSLLNNSHNHIKEPRFLTAFGAGHAGRQSVEEIMKFARTA